jgi:hypothetical protein
MTCIRRYYRQRTFVIDILRCKIEIKFSKRDNVILPPHFYLRTYRWIDDNTLVIYFDGPQDCPQDLPGGVFPSKDRMQHVAERIISAVHRQNRRDTYATQTERQNPNDRFRRPPLHHPDRSKREVASTDLVD